MAQTSDDLPLRGYTILLVEDEALVAMELTALLREQGCHVLGAANSVDRALALLETRQPDAALLDLNLRGKSASPVAQALNERGVPFFVMSGYGKPQAGEDGLGESRWLSKPVNHRELMRALKQMLTRRRVSRTRTAPPESR